MKKIISAFFALALSASSAFAQSQPNPPWFQGYIPTPGQWNAMWASKQDYLNAQPCLVTGCTLAGKLTTVAPTSGAAGFNLPAGTAPSSPTNGDMWTTNAGLFWQIGGATVGPPVASVTVQKFVTSANPTYTPNANLLYAIAECVGQGGGGGGAAASATGASSGGGGGSGSYSRVRLTAAQIGASQAVTNTAAANGGTTGNNAGTGGNDTSLGSLCIGKGGSGGGGAAANSSGTSGAGGVTGTGDITIVGNPGAIGFHATITTASGPSGAGGNGPWGGGAVGVEGAASAVNGGAGTACGSGGAGGQSEGSASTAAGGQGGNGCVIVTEFNSQ